MFEKMKEMKAFKQKMMQEKMKKEDTSSSEKSEKVDVNQ